MNLFEFQLLKHSATGQSFSENSSDLQAALHNLAGRFLVLIEGVGVNIERGRRLTMSEKPRDRADVRAAGDEQACRRMTQAVNVQVSRQIVCFEDFLMLPKMIQIGAAVIGVQAVEPIGTEHSPLVRSHGLQGHIILSARHRPSPQVPRAQCGTQYGTRLPVYFRRLLVASAAGTGAHPGGSRAAG